MSTTPTTIPPACRPTITKALNAARTVLEEGIADLLDAPAGVNNLPCLEALQAELDLIDTLIREVAVR